VRSEIGDQTFKGENEFYRDAGRELAALLDTAAVADTFKKLVEDFAEYYAATDLKWLRKQLVRSSVDHRLDRKEVLQKVAKTVESARERLKNLPLNFDSFFAIGPGLHNVYQKGRDCFEAVCREPVDEDLHEWRKQVKHLWYQITVLNPIWPNMLEAHAFELQRLSEFLSEDHDLVVLRTSVLEQEKVYSQLEDGEGLLAVIGLRREQLQQKAIALGARLYAEEPNAFVSRFQTYWKRWRPDSEVSLSEGVRSETLPRGQGMEVEVQLSSIESIGTKASSAAE
jgi:hypothetical protein